MGWWKNANDKVDRIIREETDDHKKDEVARKRAEKQREQGKR